MNQEQSSVQRTIEDTVTNGLGFESGTNYLSEFHPLHSDPLIPEEMVKHTNEGLRTHLGELDMAVGALDRVQQSELGQLKRYIATMLKTSAFERFGPEGQFGSFGDGYSRGYRGSFEDGLYFNQDPFSGSF